MNEDEIGCFFITPCPAKVTAIRRPIGHAKSSVDGAISVLEIYGLLSSQIRNAPVDISLETASDLGVGWARSGGECNAVSPENSMSVDGIENCIHVLEEIEDNRLKNLEFFEGAACTGGCVGGPLTVENAFIAKARMTNIARHNIHLATPATAIPDEMIAWDHPIPYEPSIRLRGNIANAMAKLKKIQEQEKRFPGMDCGACGAPSCHALAEDIAEGRANEDQCIFLLRGKMQRLLNSHQISLEAEKRNSDDD